MPTPFVIPTSVPKEHYYAALSSEGDDENDNGMQERGASEWM